VSYHPAHVVSRLLKALRQSLHKPQRAGRTNETRRPSNTGKTTEVAFPEKKALKEESRTIVFWDQSGLYVLRAVVRTYAPVGKRPVLKENLTRDHLWAMSAITLEGGTLYMIDKQERGFKGKDAVRFVKQLMSHIEAKLLCDLLGRLSNTSLWVGQGLFGQWGGSPAAARTACRLRSGAQP
jgi:hypothetical protein